MSILSTNQRLINVGQSYSAGENIGINDHVISSRNWSPDITYAAESAFQRATGYTNTQIVNLSGEVSSEVSQLGSDIDYISGVALTAHQSLEGYLTKASGDEYYQPIGSYATVSQLESTSGEIVNLIPTDYVNNETLEQTSGNIVNLIPDTSEFITNASAEQTYQHIGNYLSSNALEGYATQDWVGEQGYITGVDLSNYYTKNETSGADELEQAFANIPLGDEEVNELVRSNSGEWNDVSSKLDESVFQETSGLFLTAIPQEYITESDIPNFISGKLDTDVFAGVSGDFLTNEDLNGYATESFVENVSGEITALIPTDYATTTQINELSGAIDYVSANAGDQEVHNIVHTNSATWDSVTNKLDTTAFSEVSGTFLTAHQSLDGYATETLVEETSGAITSLIPTDYYPDTNPSGFISGVDLSPYATTAEVDTLSSMLSGAIDYVSANAGDEFPVSADEAIQYVENNSATINDVNTTYQTNSATYLTAHQAISADEWNSNYETVNTNSGAWGGDALPITGRDGIDLEIDNGTLYIGASALTGSIDYIQTNSANIDEVVTNYQTASGTYLTAHQSLEGYVSESGFEYDGNDLITAYNGSAFAGQGGGGGDVPTGTMNVSGLEYNAVNEISAYNGSAIAQYGAEKQWLVHDDTLVHLSNSAQYALGVNLPNISADIARMLGIDETVLWVNPNPQMVISNTTLTAELSDTISSYKKLRFICKASYDYQEAFSAAVMNQDFYTNEDNKVNSVGVYLPNRRGDSNYIDCCQIQFSGNVFTANNGIRLQSTNNTARGPYILSAIGVGRKEF